VTKNGLAEKCWLYSVSFTKFSAPVNANVANQFDSCTGSAVAATGDIHRQVPTHMADIRRDCLTNQNTNRCFVVIGLSTRQSHSPFLQLKIDPVHQMVPPYWLAPSGCQRIFINICGQYSIQMNIYIHPWIITMRRSSTHTSDCEIPSWNAWLNDEITIQLHTVINFVSVSIMVAVCV